MQMKTTGEKLRVPDFNCEMKITVTTAVALATVGGQNVTSTRFITVPYICNFKDVVEGEELIVRHVFRVKTKKVQQRVWRDVAKQEEDVEKQKAKKQKA